MGPRACAGPLCLELTTTGKKARWVRSKCNNQCQRFFNHTSTATSRDTHAPLAHSAELPVNIQSSDEHVAPPSEPFPRPRRTIPRHACSNFPLCKRARKGSIVKSAQVDDPTLHEESVSALLGHCGICQSSRPCSVPGCVCKCAPSFRRGSAPAFCTVHYGDMCTNVGREWARCSNADQGCKQLALKSTSGKCHACSEGFVPCRHACLGCSALALALAWRA